MNLLEKLCRGVKPATYIQNYPRVPLMCVNMVALVTDFVHHNTAKVCGRRLRQDVSVSFTAVQKSFIRYYQNPEGTPGEQYANDSVSAAQTIMRDWISRSFNKNLLSRSWFSYNNLEMEVSSLLSLQKYTVIPSFLKMQNVFFFCKIIQMWDNIISVNFSDEKCTNSWRQTFTKDFEGLCKRVRGTPFTQPPLEARNAHLRLCLHGSGISAESNRILLFKHGGAGNPVPMGLCHH